MLRIVNLKTEYRKDPLGIDEKRPRFSWEILSDASGVIQKGYIIKAFDSNGELMWDSGAVYSDTNFAIRYAGKPLSSRQCLNWQVEVVTTDENGIEEASLSDIAYFEIGLLERSDWKAEWIEAEGDVDHSARRPAVYFRKSFKVRRGLAHARIYQTAHGLYDFYINGQCGTEDMFKPGLTSYYHRIQYQTYDITSLLCEGDNLWSVTVADGWWRGSTGGTILNNFGHKLHYFGQIELLYNDGSLEIIPTDNSFEWSHGPLLASDMMFGDIYDARTECEEWQSVHTVNDGAKLIASGIPVRKKESFISRIIKDGDGNTVLDFGQNIAGVVDMTLRNTKAGQKIRLLHGEGLKNGVFSQENVNNTSLKCPNFQEVIYYCKGADVEKYCPSFSVFGFRYALIEGYEAKCAEDFVAYAIYSDMGESADFCCSEPLVNKLWQNSLWSQKGNFLDVPVDCPTRERNAWTGDAQVFVKTSTLFMDTYGFYEKWLKDQAIEQYASGKVGMTFPSTSSAHNELALAENRKFNPLAALAGPSGEGNIGEDAVGWGDSAVWLPYIVYLAYGDKQILRNQYECAKKWLDYELACAKNKNPKYRHLPQYHTVGDDGICDADFIYDTNFQYGEWNEPIEKTDEEKARLYAMLLRAKNEGKSILQIMAEDGKPEVATAYTYRSARAVSHMAKILDKREDAGKYEKTADRIKSVYVKYFIDENGVIERGHQAPYVRALTLGLYKDEEQKAQLLEQLKTEIKKNGYRLNTGFLSTPYLLPALADNGEIELAYKLLLQTESPSWLHSILMGATTIPEEWEGLDNFKASFNHYSYGSVCDFLISYVAGIRPTFEAAGYKGFVLAPVPHESMNFARATYRSRFGLIKSEWKRTDGGIEYYCEIPPNTTARLVFGDFSQSLGSGSHKFVF